jgi:hypothetical protein
MSIKGLLVCSFALTFAANVHAAPVSKSPTSTNTTTVNATVASTTATFTGIIVPTTLPDGTYSGSFMEDGQSNQITTDNLVFDSEDASNITINAVNGWNGPGSQLLSAKCETKKDHTIDHSDLEIARDT